MDRNRTIDVAKGIAILMIIDVHLQSGAVFLVGETFHVVTFFVISGIIIGSDKKKYEKETILETNYPAFTVPRGFKCRNNLEINDIHTNLITSIYCSKPSSITSPVESKRTELRALR